MIDIVDELLFFWVLFFWVLFLWVLFLWNMSLSSLIKYEFDQLSLCEFKSWEFAR